MRNQILDNVYKPLLEDLDIGIAQAQYLQQKYDEIKVVQLRSSQMKMLPAIKSAPNLKSLKVVDIELEKLFDEILGEPVFTSLISKHSDFYIEPENSPASDISETPGVFLM